MEISEQEKNILLDLFYRCHEQKEWINAERFSADHAKQLGVIKDLVRKNLIKNSSGYRQYRITFGAFILLEDPIINKMFISMQKIFLALKKHYIKDLQEPYLMNELAKDLDLKREDIIECLLYLKHIIIIGGTTDTSTADAFITVTNNILDFEDFDAVIERQKYYLSQHTTEAKKEDAVKLRENQLHKKLCQAIARTLWDIDPKMTITNMTKHHAIQEYGSGKYYNAEKTLHRWLSEVDPRDKAKKTGRPKNNDQIKSIT